MALVMNPTRALAQLIIHAAVWLAFMAINARIKSIYAGLKIALVMGFVMPTARKLHANVFNFITGIIARIKKMSSSRSRL